MKTDCQNCNHVLKLWADVKWKDGSGNTPEQNEAYIVGQLQKGSHLCTLGNYPTARKVAIIA